MEDNSSCSSIVTGLSGASFLQRTLERLSSTQSLRLKPEEGVVVAVIALQRHLSEQTEGQQQLDSYSYDVTVTDGVWRAKCFVHSSLNHLVHTNSLRTGTDINITQCSFVYNERRLGHGYICIENIRCGAQGSAVLPRINDVSTLPMLVKHGMERSVVLQSDVPLHVSRKHYLSLWNSDDPEGDIWTSECRLTDTVLDGTLLDTYLDTYLCMYPDLGLAQEDNGLCQLNHFNQRVSRISLLCSLESSFRNTWKPLPLLVKILHKSRLRYYGKFGLKIDYPYQAYFEVADQSGSMSLVLWNELCPEFYQRLNIGYHKGQPYVSDPKVKSFIQWTKTLKDNIVLQKTAVGGYYCYPHPPKTFTQSVTDASVKVPLVAAADLKRELETLQYREHKKLAIQGQITAVRYLKIPNTTESQAAEDKEVPDVSTDMSEQTIPDTGSYRSTAEQTRAASVTSPSAEKVLASGKKRRIQMRRPGHKIIEEEQEQESETEGAQNVELSLQLHSSNEGINKQIAVDSAYFPVVSSNEPRAVGLPMDAHGNTMLSCLSSGFLCPLDETANHRDLTLLEPEKILATASELEDTHVVCVLDLCHLGGDKVEVLINRVYRVTEASLI
ncbi:RPA-related protein RADX [Channa argus]|uniref:RPA-related protein RADX n=1 Tax=Channa argus TaxID=215402 RepID=A0A6G1QUC0_CHAAH|nr:RPA-related protein RADX [Channa argus]